MAIASPPAGGAGTTAPGKIPAARYKRERPRMVPLDEFGKVPPPPERLPIDWAYWTRFGVIVLVHASPERGGSGRGRGTGPCRALGGARLLAGSGADGGALQAGAEFQRIWRNRRLVR